MNKRINISHAFRIFSEECSVLLCSTRHSGEYRVLKLLSDALAIDRNLPKAIEILK